MTIRVIIAAIFLSLFPMVVHASVAGNVEYLSGDAWVERGDEKISLQLGDTVDAGDIVVTTKSGRVKLVMRDDSKVYVGSQSRIAIDNYEMRGGSLFSGSFSMLWGKVRFLVTKLKSGSSSFSVQTKTATIGVRGTEFAVIVPKVPAPEKPNLKLPDMPDVPTTVMLFEGKVVGKPKVGPSVAKLEPTLIRPGKMAEFGKDGRVKMRTIRKIDIKKLDMEPLRPAIEKRNADQLDPKSGVLSKRPVKVGDPIKPGTTKPALKDPRLLATPSLTKEPMLTRDPVLTKDPVLSDPVLVKDPVLTKEPVLTTEPVLTRDPIVTDPIVKDPVLSDPIVREPIITDPIIKEPVVSDPIVKDPVLSDPIVREPIIKEPIITQPIVKDPVITQPIVRDPVITQPILTKPLL